MNGCVHYDEELERLLVQWHDKHIDQFVEKSGPPHRSYVLENKEEIHAYTCAKIVNPQFHMGVGAGFRSSPFSHTYSGLGYHGYQQKMCELILKVSLDKKIKNIKWRGEPYQCFYFLEKQN